MRQVQKREGSVVWFFLRFLFQTRNCDNVYGSLELMKTGAIYAEQENNYSEILLFNTETQQEDTTEVEETQWH